MRGCSPSCCLVSRVESQSDPALPHRLVGSRREWKAAPISSPRRTDSTRHEKKKDGVAFTGPHDVWYAKPYMRIFLPFLLYSQSNDVEVEDAQSPFLPIRPLDLIRGNGSHALSLPFSLILSALSTSLPHQGGLYVIRPQLDEATVLVHHETRRPIRDLVSHLRLDHMLPL